MSDPKSTNNPEFIAAADAAKSLKTTPSNDDLIKLYSLFKQAIEGDNTTPQPGMLDLKGKAKWNGWNSQKGKSKETAQKEYIQFVKELQSK
ncbi:acyl-CoA-binding protein [Rozella allomycis CSF55]|uniref:Acyl-CoA-binding protein n=1 Tax=Rozella allomycis (strain CSF55) TaxID=988480 RepID=A0A075AMY5_ROZAC|nr:Acyl-CoA-binding-like protein [Rozella allomycis CSF55]RKP20996.1 acyl-CoA-binding protein [Rozella allomycis CSF55]|eukprot:EPZ31114.1 Acyl-CoA-binding-like protein [Rozella allomycis CSF55]